MADGYGSSKFLNDREIIARGLTNNGEFANGEVHLGHIFPKQQRVRPVHYKGDQHLITIAPNRTGKGTCAIVPNLLDYKGGVLCIDPKGENAFLTCNMREFGLGQNVQLLDPWRLAVDALNERHKLDANAKNAYRSAGFNPMDMLTLDNPNLVDDTRLVADTVIMETGGDSHWSNEAKNALASFIGYVATSESEAENRHLPRVRELLTQANDNLKRTIEMMSDSPVDFVAKGANMLMQKSEKELQSVMSTANANTHFLDSPALQDCLKKSTFDFADLKSDENPLTVYLIIPAERLQTHGRWLRVLVSMALQSITRTRGKPKIPALFILDEFAALGRMEMMEQAIGLMAGFGLKCWIFLQDMSQAQDLYKNRWQTFLANSGVIQVFGTSDMNTAEYISRTLGQMTIETLSDETHQARQGGFFRSPDPHAFSVQDREHGRHLMTPDEIMRIDRDEQILLLSGEHPIRAQKIPYMENLRYYNIEKLPSLVSLYNQHPDYRTSPSDIKPFARDPVTIERLLEARKNNAPRKKRFGFF